MARVNMKKRVYTFVSDPGHGWLSVARKDIEFLGIAKKISGYSYQNGKRVYLEEDCDASLFCNAYEKKIGIAPKLKGGVPSNDRSYVRSFADYQA